MKFFTKRIVCLFFAFLLFIGVSAVSPSTDVNANNKIITSTLNIADARRNLEGPGYEWKNRDCVLTLDDLYIETEDTYGLRLPKDCTVILEGDNYIKASKYGISCSGTVAFKGSGTLTIDAGEAGIYLISQNNTHKIRLIEGKYVINAGEYGVLSEYADFSFVGSSMSINIDNEGGFAISGRCVNLIGGTLSANAPITTTQELVVDSINLNIDASAPALTSPNLKIENISIEGASEYNGEASIIAKAEKRFNQKSIIFGDDVSAFVDYILLAMAACLISAAVVIPILHKKKKSKALYERLKAEGYLP